MRPASILSCAVLLLLAGSAAAERWWITPSGQPDAIFRSASLEDVQAKLTTGCMDAGAPVASSTPGQLTCEIPLGAAQSAFVQAMIGNPYAGGPRRFLRFSMAQIGDDVRAQAYAWMETPQGFGNVRQTAFTDDATHDALMGVLLRAGGQPPSGTTFPQRTYIGYTPERTETRKVKARRTQAIVVRSVDEDGPGARAGLLTGDIILEIDGKTFSNDAQYFRLLSKIQLGRTFPVVIERDGAEQVLEVEARAKSAVP